MFSDECLIERGKGKQREWVFCTLSQKWDKEIIDAVPKGKQILVMIWAGINLLYGGIKMVIMERDPHSNHQGYSAHSYMLALEEGLLPIYYNGLIFQQDNTHIHTTLNTLTWFHIVGVIRIIWPSCFLDLNLIKNLWAALKTHLYE